MNSVYNTLSSSAWTPLALKLTEVLYPKRFRSTNHNSTSGGGLILIKKMWSDMFQYGKNRKRLSNSYLYCDVLVGLVLKINVVTHYVLFELHLHTHYYCTLSGIFKTKQ